MAIIGRCVDRRESFVPRQYRFSTTLDQQSHNLVVTISGGIVQCCIPVISCDIDTDPVLSREGTVTQFAALTG